MSSTSQTLAELARSVRTHRGSDSRRSWWRAKCFAPWNQRRWNSACDAIENVEHDRSVFTISGVKGWNAHGKRSTRAERQYQLAEPENRLVVRTLEARWEEALKQQRQEEEEYDRFLAQLPATLSQPIERKLHRRSRRTSRTLARRRHVGIDRKQIVRCVVERVDFGG